VAPSPKEAAMLAEIFLLRLEAALRAAEEASQAGNFRFLPRAPSIVPSTPEGSKDLPPSADNHFIEQ